MQVKCQFLCTSPGICPRHKPFCSTSGCLYECPTSAYINGTECVADCGNLFVLDKKCVPLCPSTMMLTETPKLIGREIYIEKQCVDHCDQNEYVFNDTCVKMCPMTHRYIYGNNCSRTCPEDIPFINNLTVNNISFYKCVKKCKYLIENGFCTDICSANKRIFNSSCISQCPSSKPFINHNKCEQTCPKSTVFVREKTCLSRCPSDIPYIFSKSCVNICPKEKPYIMKELDALYCSTRCLPRMYYNNLTCVEKCPDGMVIENRTCTSECSIDRPYTCTFQFRNWCGATFNTAIINQTICLEQCPKNAFLLNTTCVSACPFGYKYLNATCVHKCSEDLPLLYNYTEKEGCTWNKCEKVEIKPTCTNNCPDSFYKVNRTCRPVCPDGLYIVNKTCEASCPESKMLKRLKNISIETFNAKSALWQNFWEKGTKQVTATECISSCRPGEWIFNLTCFEACPKNKTCHQTKCATKYIRIKQNLTECADICKDEEFINNNTCVLNCPNNTFVVNKTCASECPHNLSYTIHRTKKCFDWLRCENIIRYWECVYECPPGTYLLNSTCVNVCPDSTFTFNNSCVDKCPEDHRYHLKIVKHVTNWKESFWNEPKLTRNENAGFLCIESCPSGKKVFNFTCIEKCPKKSFLNGDECVYECPPENPYKNMQYTQWTCIRSCKDDDKFYYNGFCRYDCPSPLFGYDGICTEKCPSGFFWWAFDCNKRTDAVLESLMFLGTFLFILACGRKVLKEYFTVLCMCLDHCFSVSCFLFMIIKK